MNIKKSNLIEYRQDGHISNIDVYRLDGQILP